MCGIALLYHHDHQSPDPAAIRRMVAALQHRGPDAQATTLRGTAALGHARLSIVDVRGGAQPMTSKDGRHTLVYNGELYNYRDLRQQLEAQGESFTTQSDTEVLLHLYQQEGAACLPRLRGMFSFIVHDNADNSIFIVRDRLGIKPLFYHWDGHTLLAASEMKALFASHRVAAALDPASVQNYFTYQFSICPNTPFVGVKELPPGHTLRIAAGGSPRVEAYWDLEFPRDGDYESLDEDYWLRAFDDALNDAARTHTIGDVPIGAYLSGGIDSATTSYLLKQHYPETVQTFTIRFTNPGSDESAIARSIAAHIGVPNTELVMDDDESAAYLAQLEGAVYSLEQPQRMALDIPHFMLSALVRDHHYKVVYTGDGADEILGGYDCYRQNYIRLWGNDKKGFFTRRRYYLKNYAQDFSDQFMRHLMRLHRPRTQAKTIDTFGFYPVWYDFWHIMDDARRGVFTDEFARAANAEDQFSPMIAAMQPKIDGRHHLNQSLYMETKTRLPGWILWKGDRLSMAHGVEARVPFMDHPLVELAARVPPHLKLNGLDEKYILRKIMMPKMPQHPTQFKKRAFYTPIREWFLTPERREALHVYMSDDALKAAGMFRPARVREYFRDLDQLGEPENMGAYYEVMKREWALMLVLTTQMLHHQFVQRNAPCFKL